MKFVNKILNFHRGLIPGKSDKTNNEKGSSELLEGEGNKNSTFKTLALKTAKFIYKYLKKIVIIILGLLLAMIQPMINIAKRHPIAFFVAVILHSILLYGLINSNIDRWEVTQKKPSISETTPAKAIMIDIGIMEAERERLVELEKQKQQKIETEIQKSETAKEVQKKAEQETLLAKAQREFAELKRQSEEEKTKEAAKQKEISEAKAEEAEQQAKVAEQQAKEATKQKEIYMHNIKDFRQLKTKVRVWGENRRNKRLQVAFSHYHRYK